jgi:hypothetical protein
MDDETTKDSGAGDSDDTPLASETGENPPPDAVAGDAGGTETAPPRRARRGGTLRPWEALERLDRQWEDPTPLRERTSMVAGLGLTVPEDPEGFDYLGALTGAPPRAVAGACAAWLEAQLAADSGLLGRAVRPTVALVPAGRLWHVVRLVGDRILVIDGPGLPTPRAAVVAAARRYRAELVRDAIARGADVGVESLAHSGQASGEPAADDAQAGAEGAGPGAVR